MTRYNPSPEVPSSVVVDVVACGEPAREPSHVTRTPRALTREAAAQSFSGGHDEPSFTVLWCAAQTPLADIVHSKGVRDDDVDDVVGRTLSIVWKRRVSFAGTYDDFMAFSAGIARREVLKWRRRQARWQRTTVVARGANVPCAGPKDVDASVSPEEILAAREALGRLSPLEQAVLRARAEGHTWKATAAATQISVDQARRIYTNAMNQLRAQV